MPEIPVTVLGPSESGKTVYLASLFRRLAIPRPDIGFHVQLPPEQSTALNRIYQQVASPDTWPDPNRRASIDEWEFTCSVRTSTNETYSPFSIKYLDYSGEHLTEPDGRTEAANRVFHRIEESEFLLVLLDGVKVLRLFDGDFRLADDFALVFNHLMKSRAIVHFVITKWDVLAAAGHTLEAVVDCLMQHPDMKDGVETQLRNNPVSGGVRFIPVSSVGLDFAALGPDGRSMIKKGTFPTPLNVEIPFMAVLVDLFQASLKSMAQEAAPEDRMIAQRRQLLDRLRMAKDKMPIVRAFLRTAASKSPVMRVVHDYMADALMTYVETRVSDHGERVARDIAQLRSRMLQAASEKQALTGVVALFEARLAEFEEDYPGSRLIERGTPWRTT
ncbi:hypothetical protein ACFY41_01830 [Streptomyces syringium]|uniref:TRAFAC clade GTPase domain-containing protein n=1 Tax=Streptomyces syringium TaxID=76729 RepID=UPI0036CFBB43